METIWQDLRYGVRMLMKSPGFSAIAILVFALGIGANSVIFSVVNAVLIRPLPYAQPDRLVVIWENNLQNPYGRGPEHQLIVAPANFLDWKEQTRAFDQLTAFTNNRIMNLMGRDEPERVWGASVSPDFFQVLRVWPQWGRTFLSEEYKVGRHQVVILSHGLWQRQFGADPALVGKTVVLTNQPYTVVGIMPPGFKHPLLHYTQQLSAVDCWVPLTLDVSNVEQMGGRQQHYLDVIGRLRPGVTLEQARTEMATITRRLQQQYPKSNTGFGVELIPLHEQLVGNVRSILQMLFGAVGFVLLIACTNVANLLLARGTARSHEIAIRATLGASRVRIMRQLFTESVLLALLGGLVGVLLAHWGCDILLSILPDVMTRYPRAQEIGIDRAVLGVTLLMSLVTGSLAGLAPAWRFSRPDLNETLKEGQRSSSSSGARLSAVRSLLMIAEVALALVLTIGAGLMIETIWRLQQINPGFNPRQTLTLQLRLSPKYFAESHRQIAFFQQLLQRIQILPGVLSTGATDRLPFSGMYGSHGFTIEGHPPLSPGEQLVTNQSVVTPDYFRTMGITVVKGRRLTDQDANNAPGVVVINETFARRFFPDEDPLGQQLKLLNGQQPPPIRTIVGVIKDVKRLELHTPPEPEIYEAYLQQPRFGMTIVMRTAGDPMTLVSAVRRVVRELDKELPVYDIKTMEERLAGSISTRQFNMLLLSLYAAIALALAATGIYGVISYAVTQRTHEIGVRMALGAQPRDVLTMVVRQGMGLVVIGVMAGIAGAWGATRVLSSWLYGVTATDPMTFAGVSLLLTVVALIACYLPARRATRVDPIVALRYE